HLDRLGRLRGAGNLRGQWGGRHHLQACRPDQRRLLPRTSRRHRQSGRLTEPRVPLDCSSGSAPFRGFADMEDKMQHDVLRNVREGMKVVDASHKEIGKVEYVRFGNDDPSTPDMEANSIEGV